MDGRRRRRRRKKGLAVRIGGEGGAFTALNSPCNSVILQIFIQMNEEFFKELGRVVQEWGQLGGENREQAVIRPAAALPTVDPPPALPPLHPGKIPHGTSLQHSQTAIMLS